MQRFQTTLFNLNPYAVMLHKCIGSMSYKDQYWEQFACYVSKKESKEKVADMLMPEIIGYKVKEQVRVSNYESIQSFWKVGARPDDKRGHQGAKTQAMLSLYESCTIMITKLGNGSEKVCDLGLHFPFSLTRIGRVEDGSFHEPSHLKSQD